MRKFTTLVLALTGFIQFAIAQSSGVKGSVADEVDHKYLQNTVISLMRAKDSVLVKFARADKAGNFSLPNLKAGEYLVMITHPYLGDYFDKIQVKEAEVADLGKIKMIPKSKLLAEVIIKSGSPIRIKGDTTVYTADSFKVREGANVEELLRRLPGIQVDKDGKITAMGEKVTKVLVDGEEFFGTDPGIATKNLRADVVKEVEVFDKKSEQAEFTGIDDGVKDKTINLKLKEDKKKGYFGKIEAGGGLKDKYDNAAMLNAFKGKRKIAGYGILSNTGQTNLDWQDANNYGGGMEGVETGISDDGGMYMMWNGDNDDNYRGGRNGIPRNWNGGLHYSDKFNNNKQSLNGGYKFSKVNSPGVTSTFSKTFLPDTSWSTNSISNNYSSTNKHALNFTMETTIDSNNTLKWTTRANERKSLTRSNYYTESFTDKGDSINNSNRNSNNDAVNDAVTTTLLWKHKFKKLSRTLSINTDLNWNRSKNDGLLYSLNNYYKDGIIDRRDTLDQQNIRNNEGKSVSTKIAYTEPLLKDMYLEVSYSFSYNANSNERITNEDDGSGKYNNRIDSLSNSFEFNRLVNTPGLNFRVNKKKYTYSFGSAVAFSHFVQKNITDDITRNYDYTNFFPRASLTYKIKPSQNLRFNYNGSTQAPTLEQLQPITVNTDPLNIYLGNPALDQSFRHSFNLNYSSWNALKEKNLWGGLSFNMTQNAFTQFSTIDDAGRRTYQTVNVDGIYNLNLYSDYGFKIPDTKWRIGFGPNANINHNIDFVRDPKTNRTVKNKTDVTSYGIRLNIGQYVADKYNFHIGPHFTYNKSKASVNSSANAEYWQLNGWAEGRVTLPGKVEIGSDVNFQMRQKDPRFPDDNSFTTWNANVIKRILKNEMEFKFGVYDILNQNRGYNRSFSGYSFTESYYNTLKRFWLLTVTWNISKNGKPQ
ncbi:outer membrane beta-barrel family protein [Terrimonas pollutisoli]|uniref:outer membrane beta-barrel family protein n=1 Tax=Terrimonas pollutisoli TaxID=3034147 RepID=UPI0023ECFE4F|nr:outer membrane beta-barrel family protein [Terrimonas sp. H1YJ31]